MVVNTGEHKHAAVILYAVDHAYTGKWAQKNTGQIYTQIQSNYTGWNYILGKRKPYQNMNL